MPRHLRCRVPAIAAIAEELRFAPPAAARRQVERAESLARLIEPERDYPSDFLIFQITGYRPDMTATGALVKGADVLASLAALVDRLSHNARYTPSDLPAPAWMTMDDVCARWGVTRKTIERHRALGLLARRVRLPGGRSRLAFDERVVRRFDDRFVKTKRGGLETRRPGVVKEQRAAKGASRAGPLRGRRRGGRALAERAYRLGVPAAVIAERLNKSVPTVHRAVNQVTAARCRSITTAVPTGVAALLASTGVDPWLHDEHASALPMIVAAGSLPEHVAGAMARGWPDVAEERARAMAYWALLWRVAASAKTISRTDPRGDDVDRMVTDLRWASRLKAALIGAEQLLLLRTIEVQTGAPLLELPPLEARGLLRLSIAAVASAVDRFDPSRGGRLASPAGMEVNRVVSKWLAARPPRARASANAAVVLDDWARHIAPWQEWTEPPGRVREALATMPTEARELVSARYGWNDAPPRTIAALAKELGKTAPAVARLLRNYAAAGWKPAAPAR